MAQGVDIDPVLNYLGPRGRFQLWQMMLVAMGGICAENQLFDIVFIGKDVPYRCAAPNTTSGLPDFSDVTATSEVRYEECNIVVTNNVSNVISKTTHECEFGFEYDLDIHASFMSEFGLVCDQYVLVSLSQTILVLGQGFGAFGSSIISDRFGRKPVLIGSQLGLLLGGVAIGASPSYPLLVVFKFFVGACQQGVVAGISTLGIELYPSQHRSLSALIIALWWSLGGCLMALCAYLLRHHSWRVLQYCLSSFSLLMVLLQLFFMEESLRWLAANGRKKEVLRVLKRAARANNKLEGEVVATLHRCQEQSLGSQDSVLRALEQLHPATHRKISLVIEERNGPDENSAKTEDRRSQKASTLGTTEMGDDTDMAAGDHTEQKELTVFASGEGEASNSLSSSDSSEDSGAVGNEASGAQAVDDSGAGDKELKVDGGEDGEAADEKELNLLATRPLTLLDMFRHRRLRINAVLTFFAWFTVAFVVFTLFLMSTSYAGDPYINFFLAALMEAPPAFLLYFGVDRLGRKLTVQGMFALAGIGCISSAICLMFPDDAILARVSTGFAMVGMLGGSGAFAGLFFYTPEYFPTNMRNQALGTGSTVGRVSGMIAPFMKNLSQIVMWSPGLITGFLSVLVVICIYFLPETKGKELPTNIEDIEAWYSKETQPRKETAEDSARKEQ